MPKQVDGLKVCGTCRTTKPVSEYHKSRTGSDGLHNQCKACVSAAGRAWRKANPEKKKAQNQSAAGKRYYRRYTLGQYGLTEADYDQMFAAQSGVCAICKEVPETVLCVDHCHATGVVRGLLCSRCNQALGLLRDNTDFLAAAIGYLSE